MCQQQAEVAECGVDEGLFRFIEVAFFCHAACDGAAEDGEDAGLADAVGVKMIGEFFQQEDGDGDGADRGEAKDEDGLCDGGDALAGAVVFNTVGDLEDSGGEGKVFQDDA